MEKPSFGRGFSMFCSHGTLQSHQIDGVLGLFLYPHATFQFGPYLLDLRFVSKALVGRQ
jgi:hypothetical protein